MRIPTKSWNFPRLFLWPIFNLFILVFLQGSAFAIQTDYDAAVVGTSPISMLEAIYHLSKGEKVLILEADEKCGGAWKSIDICGVAHADLGCHLIGSDIRLKDFFEKYFGCHFVCLQHPLHPAGEMHERCSNGYYFSQGCYELISHLEEAIKAYPNAALLHHKLETIYIDSMRESIELSFGGRRCSTAKLILTPSSHFRVENPLFTNQEPRGHAYPHLYLLIEDEGPASFTYLGGIAKGMSRAMNLTPFLQLPGENLQLIVVQAHSKNDLEEAQRFFQAFIDQHYLTPNARIIVVDSYSYNQCYMNVSSVSQLGGKLVEVLDTSSFQGMVRYLEKWKSSLVPLQPAN